MGALEQGDEQAEEMGAEVRGGIEQGERWDRWQVEQVEKEVLKSLGPEPWVRGNTIP